MYTETEEESTLQIIGLKAINTHSIRAHLNGQMELFGPVRSVIHKLRRIYVIDCNGLNPL